VRKSVTIHL
jgi:Uncharacterized conserved protein